jgi:hypothetical protein
LGCYNNLLVIGSIFISQEQFLSFGELVYASLYVKAFGLFVHAAGILPHYLDEKTQAH